MKNKIAVILILAGLVIVASNALADDSTKLARLNFESGMTITIEINRYDSKVNHTWNCMSDSECESEESELNQGKGE